MGTIKIKDKETGKWFKLPTIKGDPGEGGLLEITTDTNIYDLDTGIYYVAEGVKLTYTEMYANDNPPIETLSKSILNVVKKVESEEKAYVYYTLTTLNSEIDPTHYSPIGMYQGSISLVNLFAVRWYGIEPIFISEKTLKNLVNGSFNYETAENKPKINNVELVGNKTLEELGIEVMGGGIPEITEDTNIFDLETGVYYVNEGVTLTYTSFPMGNEGAMETSFTVHSKVILNVAKAVDTEESFGMINYFVIGSVEGATYAGGMLYGAIQGVVTEEGSMWIALDPVTIYEDTIYTLANVKTKISENEVDDAIPTTGAVYRYVNSTVGDIESLLSEV